MSTETEYLKLVQHAAGDEGWADDMNNNLAKIDEISQNFQTNLVINGNFDIWQRGTSFPSISHGVYTADRIQTGIVGATVNVDRKDNTDTEHPSPYMFTATVTATTSDVVQFSQRIENYNAFKGKTLTFSVRLQLPDTTNKYQIVLYDSVSGITVNIPKSTNWQTVTGTYTINSEASSIVLLLRFSPTDENITSSEFNINYYTLNVGSTALPFNIRSYGEELALCMRYYQKSYAQGTSPGTVTIGNCHPLYANFNGTYVEPMRIQLNPTMRCPPTVVIYSPYSGSSGYVYDASTLTDLAIWGTNSADNLLLPCFPVVEGRLYRVHYTADAELY